MAQARVLEGGWSRRLMLAIVAAWLAAPPAALADHVIDAARAFEQAAGGGLVIIDVRTPGEWRQTGVPKGAAPISLYLAPGVINQNFVADVAGRVGGDKSVPIAAICAVGNRSAAARDLLAANGFTAVTSIADGMFGSAAGPGWLARKLPVEACATC